MHSINLVIIRNLLQRQNISVRRVIKRQRHWRVVTAINSTIFTDRYLLRQLLIKREINNQIGLATSPRTVI